MAHHIQREFLNEIRQAEWFALISDETSDSSRKEQLVVSIRWIDESYVIHEDLIGMFEVAETDAATLSSVIKDVLIRCSLKLGQCRGQTYDGAANMAGHISGVADRLSKDEPRALYVHCMAHSLNLCLQDCARKCHVVRDALHLVSELCNLIRASPKRLASFTVLKDALSPSSPGIKPLCPTRWTVRIDSVLKNYDVIIKLLEEISENYSGEVGSKASGLVVKIEKFNSFFGLKLSFLVFSGTEQLSTTLQSSNLNSQEAMSAANAANNYLRRLRSDSAFTDFYKKTVKEADGLTEEPKLPRQRQIPKRYDSGSQNRVYEDPETFYRHLYFEVLDLLIMEIQRRFD